MLAEAYLNHVREFPLADLADLTHGLPFIVLSPHPDDESLGVGGLIAMACRAGQSVDVVVLTDGSASHPKSKLYPRERLIETRHVEVERAAQVLKLPIDRVHHFGMQDSSVPTHGQVFEDAVTRISEIIERSGAKTLFVTWWGDPHCDHEAASLIAEEVRDQFPLVRLLAYPIWGWHLRPSVRVSAKPPSGWRIDITEERSVKRAAIAAHASQMTDLITDDPEGFRFSEETLAPFLGPYEYFIEVPA
jgi:LmbE family N-acetylglucosaminyl deacetylase